MAREELRLEAIRFTSLSALVREIGELLQHSNYKLVIVIPPIMREPLDSEMEGWRMMRRVKVEELKDSEALWSDVQNAH